MTPVSHAERAALLAGLRRRPPRVEPMYLYDTAGSRLFDRITRLPEYYPTRIELEILRERGQQIVARIAPGTALLELGSGSAEKALVLLAHLSEPRLYRPIDISKDALDRTVEAVRSARPDLMVAPFLGDFGAEGAFTDLPVGAPRLVYYSGSTIGNLEPRDAVGFLRRLRDRLVTGDALLLAADLVKDPDVLRAAYNDSAGVTAAFNKNLLAHLNVRFEANFDLELFDHRAVYAARERRIEMHLVPRHSVEVTVAGERFLFGPAWPIHTESSYKFRLDDLANLARRAGYSRAEVITDERKWFAEALFQA